MFSVRVWYERSNLLEEIHKIFQTALKLVFHMQLNILQQKSIFQIFQKQCFFFIWENKRVIFSLDFLLIKVTNYYYYS